MPGLSIPRLASFVSVLLFLALLIYVEFFFAPVCFPKGWQPIISPSPRFALRLLFS